MAKRLSVIRLQTTALINGAYVSPGRSKTRLAVESRALLCHLRAEQVKGGGSQALRPPPTH